MRVGAHFNVVITLDYMYPEGVMSDVGWLQILIKHADWKHTSVYSIQMGLYIMVGSILASHIT